MWKPLARCSIVGGVLVFLWMMISWMVMPLHKGAINQFTDESEVASCISRYAPTDGIYAIPSMGDQAPDSQNQTWIFVNLKRGVDFSNMTGSIICGLLTQMAAAGIITYLLLKAKAMKYWGRVWFVTLAGLLVAVLSGIPGWNWWHFPFSWVLLEMIDLVVGWFLGGLVIAKLIKK